LFNEIKSAFTTYAEGLSPDGFLVGCGDSDNVREVVKNTPAQLIFYGTNEDNDWRLVSHQVKDEKSVWQISGPEGERELTIGLPGVDLALDVLASVIMARQFDIEWSVIEEVVANFQGAKRRFEKKWVSDDVVVIDDYAHHPTEIASLIRAIKELYPDRNLYAVFQPHQLSRTKLLYDDFVKVLSGIDNLAILPVFVVRDIGGSTEAVDLSRKLAEAIGAKFINDFAEAQGWLKQGSKPMIWLTLGAGRTNYLADELVDKLSGES
jgi:UDP-N-acetylmuramate--alanine ligase